MKKVLVTGASRGIGKAIAQHLAGLGYYVIGTATTDAGVERIKHNLQPICTEGYAAIELNLLDRANIDNVVQQLKDDIGMPEILINNAGFSKDSLLLRMNLQDWDDVLQANLSGCMQLVKACVKDMLKQRWGRIVNISSIVAHMGNPGQSNYAAAKAGLLGFAKSLAHEVAQRGITVNNIAPGFVDTDMTRSLSEQQIAELTRNIAMKRMGVPTDIAYAVEFLISAKAEYITGQTIHVNGGMLMN